MPSKARDANWIDGLRGVASFTIVTGHLCTAFIPWMHAPALGENGPVFVMQWPVLRLLVGGRSAVALFFLITGYVTSLSSLRLAKAGDTSAAFGNISRSALARTGRLVLPTIIATTISWAFAQIGAYGMAKHCDATWIRQGYHDREPTLSAAVYSLVHAEIQTWTVGWDEYDGTQWTLILFLQGAFLVYTFMLASMHVTPRARKAMLLVLYVYSWLGNQPVKAMNIFFGIFMAELQTDFSDSATTLLPGGLPALVIFIGMLLCSFPQNTPEWMSWSEYMRASMMTLTPQDADLRRYWDSLGASTILLGVFFSGNARKLLSSPLFNYLGRVSFPVYLLHNQLIKTLMTWMIYFRSWLHPRMDGNGIPMDLERGPWWQFAIAIPIFYFVLYRLAYWWTLWLDPMCERIVKKTTSWMIASEPATGEKSILLT